MMTKAVDSYLLHLLLNPPHSYSFWPLPYVLGPGNRDGFPSQPELGSSSLDPKPLFVDSDLDLFSFVSIPVSPKSIGSSLATPLLPVSPSRAFS